ncbi:MAG TPA: SDR family oxidoreductase [Thermoanaerobaculia bacterium]
MTAPCGTGGIAGRVAVVTGAASGIGLATARMLAGGGAAVVVVDLRREALERAAAEIAAAVPGADLLPLAVDVRRPDEVEEMRRRTVERWGRLDVLVASAGVLRGVSGRPQTVLETTPEDWDRVVDTNLTGVFLTNRAVLSVMMEQGSGDIVNLSSTSGRRGLAYDGAYCASKFGVIGFSESLADEVRSYGIRVQVVLPEMVDTPLLAQNGPLPRPPDLLRAEAVAALIVHLVSLPEDSVLLAPVIAPFRASRRGSATRSMR